MHPGYMIGLTLVDPARMPGELFSADANAADSDAIAARNAGIEARLRAALPGFAPLPGWRAEMAELCDDDLPVETLLRRHQRARAGRGPWSLGFFDVELFDDLAEVTVSLAQHGAGNLAQEFAALLDTLTTATGFVPWDPRAQAPLADAAPTLLARHAQGLARHRRAVRLDRIQQALAVPSLVGLTLLAALAVALTLGDGVQRGTLMAGVDPESPATFTTESLAPVVARFGLFPQYTLLGKVGQSWLPVQLPVYRAEYIASGPGAQFPVLPTSDPATPYVLRSALENAGPILRLGGFGVALPALLALVPATLWQVFVARPLWRAPSAMRGVVMAGMPGKLGRILGIVAVTAVAMALRVGLGR
jgi:hypothetical protein